MAEQLVLPPLAAQICSATLQQHIVMSMETLSEPPPLAAQICLVILRLGREATLALIYGLGKQKCIFIRESICSPRVFEIHVTQS